MQPDSGTCLKQIGAQIILLSIVFMAFAVKAAHAGSWFYKFWPLIGFAVLCIGAVIGVAGFSLGVIERHRNKRAG